MADWIFQGNPRRHDLDALVTASRERWWGTPRYRDRVSARSAVRAGQPLQLAVDTSRLHFFDPVSGQSIGHPLTVTDTVPA